MKLIVNEKQYNSLLKETRGFVKVAEDWSHIIVDEIMKYIFNIEGEDVLTMTKLTLKYGDKPFFKELPIESITILVDATRIEDEEGGADASYVPYWSHLEDDVAEDNIVIEDVEFNLDIDIPKTANAENSYDVIRDYIFQMFSHELLHVYEWYKRGLEDPAERKDCMGVFTSGNIHGNAVERLAYIIYTQLSFEMNAFVHQAGTMLRMRDIETYEDFKRELESLFIWDFVQAMLDFDVDEYIEEIKTLSKEDKEQLTNMKLCYYSSKDDWGDTEINPKSVGYSNDRFLKDLSQKFQVRGLAMKRKLYRLASDIL
jgi:hypothetical protein